MTREEAIVWKDIEGYEKLYSVSNQGQVKSIRKNVILKPFIAGNGYLTVKLSKCGKSKNFKVHRLVALAFCENEKGYSEINHLDENKYNNDSSNLEWCDRKHNCNYGDRNNKIARYRTGRKKVS